MQNRESIHEWRELDGKRIDKYRKIERARAECAWAIANFWWFKHKTNDRFVRIGYVREVRTKTQIKATNATNKIRMRERDKRKTTYCNETKKEQIHTNRMETSYINNRRRTQRKTDARCFPFGQKRIANEHNRMNKSKKRQFIYRKIGIHMLSAESMKSGRKNTWGQRAAESPRPWAVASWANCTRSGVPLKCSRSGKRYLHVWASAHTNHPERENMHWVEKKMVARKARQSVHWSTIWERDADRMD